MFDVRDQIPHRLTIIAVFVLVVFGTSAVEIFSEFADGETLDSMIDDLIRFAFATIVLAMFFFEHCVQRRALGELRGQLRKARGQLAQIDTNSQKLVSQYRAVMQ